VVRPLPATRLTVQNRRFQENRMLFRSPKLGFALLALTATTQLMSTAKANTISLGASRDATIYQNTPDNSNGAGFTTFAGNNGMDSPRRSLLDFDVAGNVPAGSTIDSVQLSLVLQGVAGVDTTPRTISLLPLLTNWGEGTSGMGLGGGGTGQGFPAKQGDATWSQNFFGVSAWTNSGGDFSTFHLFDDWVASIFSICSSVRQIRARRLSARSRCAVPTAW
jgi:hypothetical protein